MVYPSGMEIMIATNNKHKLLEFQRIFKGYSVSSPGEAGIDFYFDETGDTFLENSMGKAMALHNMTGKAAVADDSGLCVPALNNQPGVYSARYGAPPGGPNLETPQRNQYLLKQMEGIKDRRAYFVCCMVLVISEQRFFVAQETVEGVITHTQAGKQGFGYDPLFYVPDFEQTIAQLDAARKDSISHRGRAARVIAGYLRDIR